MERTFVLVKPDGVQRGLVGEIIARLEKRGLKTGRGAFRGTSARPWPKSIMPFIKGKSFYDGLIRYITSSPGDGNGLGRTECGRSGTPDDGRHPTA